jgi:ACS family tartrate transporter-like MFS transporter
VLGIYFTSRHSDDTGERYLHMAIPCFIAAASLVGAMLAGATPLGLVLLIVLGGALGCALAPYWAIPFRLLPPPQRAIGISVINVLASSSGLIVPMVIGKLKDATNGFAVPAYALSAMIALAGVLVMTARNLEAKGKR